MKSPLFSLTPALSRWEREPCRPRLDNPRTSANPRDGRTLLPLPAGEGRGEGERPRRARAATNLAVPLSLCLAFLLTLIPTAHARISVTSLPGRDSVQLTIYNSADLTLVKETRSLTFRKGLNKLEFSWANTLIDPTSVEFRALTHADAVEVLDVSFPPRVTNTLEWRINSEFAGEITVEIRYFTSGISWSADYVAEVNKPEKQMQLAGFVRVNNHSGEDYENAAVRLVVGTIKLVEEIAALARKTQLDLSDSDMDGNRPLSEMRRKDDSAKESRSRTAMPMSTTSSLRGTLNRAIDRLADVQKEALSEYFLYTVEGRDTIPNGWSKRLPSFSTAGVPLVSLYKFEAERTGASVVRYYAFTNNVASQLGKEPLPDGAVRAFRTVSADNLLAYVGATVVKYIPINERVEMELGADSEVLVKPTLMNWEKTNLNFDAAGNVTGWTTKTTWEIELQNSRDIAVLLDVRRNFSGDWTLETQTPHETVDTGKVKFLVPLAPRAKQKLTYELTTRHGTNATK